MPSPNNCRSMPQAPCGNDSQSTSKHQVIIAQPGLLQVMEVSMPLSSRLERELKTITAMVRIYCHKHHDAAGTDDGELCEDCSSFLAYAEKRLARCPYGEKKPTCGNCPTHCYKQNMQTKAQQIMRYAGPKMVWHHPLMAYFHLIDSRRKPPLCVNGRQIK